MLFETGDQRSFLSIPLDPSAVADPNSQRHLAMCKFLPWAVFFSTSFKLKDFSSK
jgi:hypothetical protein